uniref:uncharacterized protein LOC122579762 n=1 Tax=Erigeron canadensis TaxID=72917 RepID=UPI001CB9430E|nr:uncharacterized protein LOC122579762 [Erigeron canadensis]
MAASFTSPQTLLIIKNLQAPTTGRCRLLLSSSTCLRGNPLRASKSWGEEQRALKRHHNHAVAHSRTYCGAIHLDCYVSCIPRVISGFWMGPDIEDGWGFVEATMNQIHDTF